MSRVTLNTARWQVRQWRWAIPNTVIGTDLGTRPPISRPGNWTGGTGQVSLYFKPKTRDSKTRDKKW
ncbi:Uncharacterized protein HZ326_21654 [Fusarium oxysporum f. sp. albedinis]|nr:Uncharacterized protein HZ326_21654 [Fusarium oxysporum f. sp. albedinis]